mgnify:CR=1 FL=1
MDYYGIGYSNIRLPNSSKSYMYKYDSRINTFPEEVFLHEFLHSLENLTGLKDWYQDYMNKNIKSSEGLIGLSEEVYNLKPAKDLDFKYSYSIDEFHEPQNVIEQIRQLFRNVINNVKYISTLAKENTN